MAITDNGTAHAVNTLARGLFGYRPYGQELPAGHEVTEALAMLADAACRQLGAGITGDLVRELLQSSDDEVAACRLCGCTEEAACEGGCHWVPDPLMLGELCSVCLEAALAIAAAYTGVEVSHG